MSEIALKNNMMTSLEIAEVAGKQHKDLMRAIRNMEDAWERIAERKFALSEYTDVTGRTLPCYLLTKTECLYISTKFNDEARAKLVLRWEQLEKERIMQGAIRHMLVTDSDIMNEAERIVTNTLVNSNRNADGCFTASDIAKAIGIDVQDLNSFLVDRGIQQWRRGQFRLTKNYEGRHLTEDRLFIYYSKEGKQKKQTYLVWTQKGADFINSLL